jgi:DNA-binding NarL/FixJ family response regulator
MTGKALARVMIVDDHPTLRRGLAEFIDGEPDMQVCAQASGVTDTLRLLGPARPDVAIVDIRLPDGSGLELIKQIRLIDPSVRMLVLTMYEETLYAERALRAGALGYLTKDEASDRVIEGIRQVLRGEVFLSDRMSLRMLRGGGGGLRPTGGSSIARLSDRELEVFDLIGHAQSTRQIADRLRLSVKTIETHRESIKRKLSLEGNLDLIHAAMQWVFERDLGPAESGDTPDRT